MLKHYITRADIEACVRADPGERKKYEDAKLAATRQQWSTFDLDAMFLEIASGTTLKEAVRRIKGADPKWAPSFSAVVVHDEIIAERYKRAMEARTHLMVDEAMEIADASREDVLDTGTKGLMPNQAAVNRARLQVETRYKFMTAWNKAYRESNKTDVQVAVQVNHSQTLEDARQRAKFRQASPRRPSERAIDASFHEVGARAPAPADDMAWMG